MKSIKRIIGLLFLGLVLSSSNMNAQQEGFIGEIKMFGGTFAPRGWAFCDGQLLAISSNTALFSILGCQYGGDCRTTFALPDFRGRAAISAGRGPGLQNYPQASRGGSEFTTLTQAQLPSHNHIAAVSGGNTNLLLSTDNAVNEVPQPGDVPAVVNFPGSLGAQRVKAYGPPSNTVNGQSVGGNVTIGSTGGSQQVDKRQPFLTVRYIICLQGVFPSRS